MVGNARAMSKENEKKSHARPWAARCYRSRRIGTHQWCLADTRIESSSWRAFPSRPVWASPGGKGDPINLILRIGQRDIGMASLEALSWAAPSLDEFATVRSCCPFCLKYIAWTPCFLYAIKEWKRVRDEDCLEIPRSWALTGSASILCSVLDKAFGSTLTVQSCEVQIISRLVAVWADKLQKALIRPSITSERFASSASLQYHEELRDLNNLVVYVKEKLCPKGDTSCQKDALRLAHADHLDIDYDAVSQTLTLSAYFEGAISGLGEKEREGWNDSISDYAASVPTEIGILSIQKATQPEDVSLGGFLITLDKDKPSECESDC